MNLGEVTLADGATWSTPAWPLLVPAIGVCAAFGLLIAAAVAPRSGGGRPWAAANVAVATIFAAAVAAGAPTLVQGARADAAFGQPTAEIFGRLLLVESTLVGLVVVLLGAAVAVWAARPPAGEWPWIRLGLAVPVFTSALVGGIHAVWLRGLGDVPGIVADLPPRVHVGRTVEAAVRVVGAANPTAWSTRPISVVTGEVGPVEVAAEVWRFGLAGRRTQATLAGADSFAPAVAISVGDTWVFEETTSWRNQYLWVVPAPGRAVGPRVTVRVAGKRELPALTVYDVEVVSAESVAAHAVYAWNGAALLYVPPAAEGAAPLDEEPAPFLALEPGAARGEDGTVPCTTAVFPGGCSCFTTPPGGPLALAGPARCEWTQGSGFSAGVSAFLAVVTLGLVIEDPNRTKWVEIVASSRDGQEPGSDAAGSPPQAPPPGGRGVDRAVVPR